MNKVRISKDTNDDSEVVYKVFENIMDNIWSLVTDGTYCSLEDAKERVDCLRTEAEIIDY